MTATLGARSWPGRPSRGPTKSGTKGGTPRDQKPPEIPPAFKHEVLAVTGRHVPEYASDLTTLAPEEWDFLYHTMEYWTSRKSTAPGWNPAFRAMKIVECVAFWRGLKHHQSTPAGPPGRQEPPRLASARQPTSHPKSARPPHSRPTTTRVALVIPVGTEDARVLAITRGTLEQAIRHPACHAAYVVFDGCADARDLARVDPEVRPIQLPENHGPALARNLGLKRAMERDLTHVLFVDADVKLENEAMVALVARGRAAPGVIWCPLVESAGTTPFDAYHDWTGTLNGRYASAARDTLLFGTTSCMLCPTALGRSRVFFPTAFREAAGEDIAFCLHAREAGFTLAAANEIRVTHWYGYAGSDGSAREARENWTRFARRFERYGRGEAQLLQEHPRYYQRRQQSCERHGDPKGETGTRARGFE